MINPYATLCMQGRISAFAYNAERAVSLLNTEGVDQKLVQAARARALEAEMLFSLAAGLPWTVAPLLAPLATMINDISATLQHDNALPVDLKHEEDAMKALEAAEQVDAFLDHARVAGLSLLAALTRAHETLALKPFAMKPKTD